MKKNQPQKINRINYIVQENPTGVSKLLRSEGIQVPQNLQGLILKTKEWVSKEGQPAILKLLQEHPEKDLLLSLNQAEQFDTYSDCGCKSSFTGGDCGCKSSYSGKEEECPRCKANAKKMTRDELWKGLEEMRKDEFASFYKNMKQAAKEQPNNTRIKEELEIAWEFIRGRDKSFQPPTDSIIPQITPPQKKVVQEEEKPIPSKDKKRAGKQALFTISTKEFAITGILLGVTLLIAQFKS